VKVWTVIGTQMAIAKKSAPRRCKMGFEGGVEDELHPHNLVRMGVDVSHDAKGSDEPAQGMRSPTT
jgi:hypothetical protein